MSWDSIISEEMLVDYFIPPKLIELANTVYIDDPMPIMVDKTTTAQMGLIIFITLLLATSNEMSCT